MPQSEISSPIETFWSHQAFSLAGPTKLSNVILREEWSSVLTGAKLLTHMQKLSTGMTHFITLAEDLPIRQIQFTFDVIGGKLGNANRVIQSVLARLDDLFDPVVPHSYLAARLNEAFRMLRGVRLLGDQRRVPRLGPDRWMGYHGRKWDREILESIGSARAGNDQGSKEGKNQLFLDK